ncbi:MAG: hypothetical protein RR034_00515 [Bacteroidales bacterium]
MKKTMFAVLITLLVVLAGCKSKTESPAQSKATEEITDSNCELMKVVFDLDTPHPFTVNVPDTKVQCILSKAEQIENGHILHGEYTNGDEKGEITLVLKRGELSVLGDQNDADYFVAPFEVSNQGSGIFTYIGLFSLNLETKTVKQIASYFLGDRITLENVSTENNIAEIDMKVHGPKQAMAEDPTEKKTIILHITPEGFTK